MNDTPKHAQVIAVGNQKGGVGKTSNTLHLAAALGEQGKKILVIDLDGNCGATRGCGLGTDWLGTFEALMGQDPEELIVGSDPVEGTELPENVELLPARRNLESFEEEFRRTNKFREPSATLTPVLDRLRHRYDFIFLDTAPNASAPTVASYLSADWFILSTEPAKLSVEGLTDALMDIQSVREQGNAGLRLLGVVMCKVRTGTRVAEIFTEKIRKEFQAAGELGAFRTTISMASAIESAQYDGKTLFQTEPSHKVADQYRALAQEILGRLETARAASEAEPKPDTVTEASNA